MKKQVKQTVDNVMAEIIVEAEKRLKFDDKNEKFACLCVCYVERAWQVWLNWGKGGKPNNEVLVDGIEFYEGERDETLIKTLRTFLGLVQEKNIEAV